MFTYDADTRRAIADVLLGVRVDRATASLPQTAAAAIFNIVGGRVAVMGILGEVTVAIQNQACNTKLTANPTTGTSVDLCTVLSIANDEVGCLYGITGTVGDAMIGANAGYAPLPSRPLVVGAGTIDLDTAASNSGSVKWSIWYVPLDDGAYVTAA
jgi:hypothetical protein